MCSGLADLKINQLTNWEPHYDKVNREIQLDNDNYIS